jgi:type II secretory ATPase GspE/PulE/Tfp pilus assembly ATPase PilB-like protein
MSTLEDSAANVPPVQQEAADAALWIDIESDDVPFVVHGLLEHVAKMRVSDLFFCAEEYYMSVSARHLGIWQLVSQMPSEIGKRCLAHIKSMASMDVVERRRPQDGRWIFETKAGETIDLRISTIPTLYGEDCTLRFLARQTQLLSLDKLGLLQRDYNYLLQMLNNPSGLLLVTGPTGSGKTTTLYACINYLNNGQRKINTIEDPVEYALVRIRQSQVNPVIELGFADILRGVLRQAPDVVMIGEVRDVETAAIAVRAAASGHLVLATLHAPIAAAAIQSMLTLGVHPYQLASCLLGCIAQRLVRTLDPATKVPFDVAMAPGIFEEVRRWLAPGQGEQIYGPPPGLRNPSLGYTNRTGVFEVMPVTHAIRQLIMQQQPTPVIRRKAVEEGMIEMRQAALLTVARGDTSVEEVFRAIPSEYLNVDE